MKILAGCSAGGWSNRSGCDIQIECVILAWCAPQLRPCAQGYGTPGRPGEVSEELISTLDCNVAITPSESVVLGMNYPAFLNSPAAGQNCRRTCAAKVPAKPEEDHFPLDLLVAETSALILFGLCRCGRSSRLLLCSLNTSSKRQREGSEYPMARSLALRACRNQTF